MVRSVEKYNLIIPQYQLHLSLKSFINHNHYLLICIIDVMIFCSFLQEYNLNLLVIISV